MRRALVVGLALSAACGGKPNTLCTNALCGAFVVHEEDEGGGGRDLDADQHLAPVDYQSRIRVTPDRDKLAALTPGERNVLPPRSADEEQRLRELSTLLDVATRYVAAAAKADKLALDASAGRATDAHVSEAIKAQADLGSELFESIGALARARADAQGLTGTAQDVAAAQLVEPLFLNQKGRDVLINLERFGAFLDQELRSASASIAADQQALLAAGTVRLRIRAFVHPAGKASAAVHVANYDDIEDARPAKRRRITFRMTDAERERVRRGWELAQTAADLIDKAKNDRAQLVADLRGLAASIKKLVGDELRALATTDLEAVLRTFVSDLSPQSAKLPAGSLKQRLDALADLVEQQAEAIKGLKEQLSALSAAIAAGTNPVDALEPLLANADKKLLDLGTDFNRAKSEIEGAIADIRALAVSIRSDNTIAKTVRDAVSAELDRLVQALTAIVTPYYKEHVEPFVELARGIRALSGAFQTTATADSLSRTAIDPRVRTVSLDRAAPALVDLSQTSADRGDRVVIRAELVQGSEDDEELLESMELTYAVERFGLGSDFGAGLVFVKRRGEGEMGDPKVNFDPAPSISWTLTYRTRKVGFLNRLQPGVGLGVAALDFTDGAPQLGVGAELSVFDRILYAGYGWNLQVSTDRNYWYLGIGIIEAARSIGGLF